MAVRFCEIGWLNVSVKLCVFCSSVFLCEKKNNCETHWGGISLTDLTDLTDPFCAQFRFHRTPPAYRIHRTFQLTSAITFCNICRLLADVCVFSLFAERLLSLCETLWEIKHATAQDVRWMASVPLWKSVRDRIHHEPRRMQKGFCSFVKICERWNIQRALFKTTISGETDLTTSKESNTCKHE